VSLHTSAIELDLATALGATDVSLQHIQSLSWHQANKPVYFCACIQLAEAEQTGKQHDNPLLLYLHLTSCSTTPGDRASSELDTSQPCALELGCILHVFSQRYLFVFFFFTVFLGGGVKHALSVLTLYP